MKTVAGTNKDSRFAGENGYKWRALTVAVFGAFAAMMDATAVNVALPTLQRELKGATEVNAISWVISGYVLALGVVTPLAGLLSDTFGIKRIYLSSLAAFTAGSLLCAMAGDLPMLIIARIIQGIGGGALIPLGIAILFDAFPMSQRGMAFGFYGIPLVFAPALGPIIGGALVEYASWHYIFLINLPIGIAGVALGYFWLKKSPVTRGLAVDWLGIIFSTLGFGTILYAFSTVGRNRDGSDDWGSPLILSLLIGGSISLLLFAAIELKFKEPLINLRLFKRPVFALGNVIGWAGMVALFGPNFLLPLYLQGLRHMSPLETGLLLLPLAITSGILAPFAGKIFDMIGGRLLMVIGFVLLSINTWQLAGIEQNTDLFYIGVLMAVRGIALGLIVQNTVSATLSVVEGTELPRASSLTNASRQVAQALGIAVLATLVQGQLNQMGAGGMSNPNYTTAFMQGLKDAYIFALTLSVIALGLSFFLPGWPGKKLASKATPEPLAKPVPEAGD